VSLTRLRDEAATHYVATDQCYPEYDLFEPCQNLIRCHFREDSDYKEDAITGFAAYRDEVINISIELDCALALKNK